MRRIAKRKWWAILVAAVLIMALLVAACAPQKAPPTEFKKMTLSMSCIYLASSPPDFYNNVAADKFADYVSEATGGQVTVKTFALGELYGGYTEALLACMGGALDIVVSTQSGYVANGMKEFGIFATPGLLVPSPEESYFGERADRFWADPDGGGKLRSIAEAKGLKQFIPGGFGSDFPVVWNWNKQYNMEEVNGLKLRAPPSPGYRIVMDHLGITAAPIATLDTYMGLKQGLIDGGVTAKTYIYLLKWYEVCPYIMEEPILPIVQILSFDLEKWNSLSPQLQEVIEEAMVEYSSALQTHLAQERQVTDDKLTSAGVTLYRWSDEELNELNEWYNAEAWPFFRPDYGDLMDVAIKAQELR